MTAVPAARLVRICPGCGSHRPSSEITCEFVGPTGVECGWFLLDEPLVDSECSLAPEVVPIPFMSPPSTCVNGHTMEEGDQVCLSCGGDLVSARSVVGPQAQLETEAEPTVIDGWIVGERLPSRNSEPWERFLVRRQDSDPAALLTMYCIGAEPDRAVHDVLGRMPTDHVPQLFATGRFNGRAYDVVERVQGGSLAEGGHPAAEPELFRVLIDELGRALASFAEVGLRHRDLRPETILIRDHAAFDLVVTGFGSARLSDFDLEAVAPLQLSRYSAPEAIVGTVSAASDWWSLGMIALEQATKGTCFAGVNDQALLLHVVTRGMVLPANIEPQVRLLLRGLLARDPLARWSWPQVRAWLAGEPGEAPDDGGESSEDRGPSISLASRSFRRPELYALGACEAANWAEGSQATLRGVVATWLDDRAGDPTLAAEVRRIASDEGLTEDLKHALAMMALNRDLPLAIAGEIVTPAWLLRNPDQAFEIVTGEATRHLERMRREPWLVRLRVRAETVREEARLLEIELDESSLRLAMLASSRANLEAECDTRRQLFPDTDHLGLASILERPRITDEELVMLVSAAIGQFTPIGPLVDSAVELALRARVPLDPRAARELLARRRREIFADVDGRTARFARCGNQAVDDWADQFRVERRMPLPRAAVLLAVPSEEWREPPKQQYVSTLLEFFEKRVSGAIGRGPLVRFIIGRTTPRVDLAELNVSAGRSEALVRHVLARTQAPVPLDTSGYVGDLALQVRLRRLGSHAAMFRRDTGIDGRYMGFPFLLMGNGRNRSDNARPRIAPALLWPVSFEFGAASAPIGRGGHLAFDGGREEVRLNPALESMLGPDEVQRWRDARDDLLARPSLRVGDVMDMLAHLATPRGRTLTRVPGRDARAVVSGPELIPAAALFNAEFTGQAVAEDLRLIRGRSIAGTALEAALRIVESSESASVAAAPERDRYNTVESDPSQDAAVLCSRRSPGLLVEGPPGTGKSQTIVNVVADAIGHGQTVLVVCQKLAALKVVQKRLEAEGLGKRLFLLADVNKDRTSVVSSLRDQIPVARAADPGRLAELEAQRAALAARIEAIDGEVDRRHSALHVSDRASGLPYRGIISHLIDVEASGLAIEAPRLRILLSSFDLPRLSVAEETCGPLARDWLASRFEGNALSVLKCFGVDDQVEKAFRDDLGAFLAAEEARTAVPKDETGFETDDPARLKEWMAGAGAILSNVFEDVRVRLAAWFGLFRPTPGGTQLGGQLISALGDLLASLRAVDPSRHNASVFDKIAELPGPELAARIADIVEATTRPSLLQWLNPFRWAMVDRANAFAKELGQPEGVLRGLLRALNLEIDMRPLRGKLREIQEALRAPSSTTPLALEPLKRETEQLLVSLKAVEKASVAILACPAGELAERTVRVATAAAYEGLRATFEIACVRHDARQRSRAALSPLSAWVEETWAQECNIAISRNASTSRMTAPILQSLGTLAPFQRFRARVSRLPANSEQVLAGLRQSESQLAAVPATELDAVVRRTIRREALLSWKSTTELRHPELLSSREELESKIEVLSRLDCELRGLNRRLLASGYDRSRVGAQASWDGLTRLTGPRTKRLREILDRGADLGLMHLRPIWLMNPDVASRVLPLRAGLFDLVIYDEASQMPVEHAIPTLFRGTRVVISGDEKQMPPSSFFSGGIESEEEDGQEGEELDELATEAERTAAEESWNKREVKDCPDLLQLGRWSLPKAMLQIHYRSNYRELIGFSNSAFYAGSLNVPVRHPEDQVRRARPVEVVRVDGTYAGQTNLAEADRVVELLAGIWCHAAGECPSVGVVTFNRKQADAVEDALERRAETDLSFSAAMARERDRRQNGEDMGFFVKNVENVQGDERDVIIFSTTFGRDGRGTFRRNFGVLGQVGGERRLNVAVTRARDKVVLVTSIPVNDVSDWLTARRRPDRPRDYLQAYLDYATKLDAGEFELVRDITARLGDRPAYRVEENRWERDGFRESVGTFLRRLGYEPVAADEARDVFSMDFAIVDRATGLFGIGIECESPRHELLANARAREVWRQGVMRRVIPVLHRVSAYDWYHRPQHERARLQCAVGAAISEEAA